MQVKCDADGHVGADSLAHRLDIISIGLNADAIDFERTMIGDDHAIEGAMLAQQRGQDNAAMMRRHANLE